MVPRASFRLVVTEVKSCWMMYHLGVHSKRHSPNSHRSQDGCRLRWGVRLEGPLGGSASVSPAAVRV